MSEEHRTERKRGPYGEILPPPLVGGVAPEEALARLVADNAEMGVEVSVPGKGRALEGMYNVALVYVHQLRLREALAGRLPDDPDAEALRRAVMEERELLSLRPPGLEHLVFTTFAPVLRHLGDGRWRVGLPDHGQVEEFEEDDPGRAVERAQALYVAWSEADDDAFDREAKKALKASPRSLFHDFWLAGFEETGVWERGGGFRLTLLGRHNTMQLDTPRGSRIIKTGRLRGVQLCDALARRAGVKPPYPPPGPFQAWLVEAGASTPGRVEWTVGPGQVGLLARIRAGGRELALVRRRGLVLYPLERGKYGKRLTESAWEEPLTEWLAGEEGRATLITWALWAAGV